MCFPGERREKEGEKEKRRREKKHKKYNHWFLAVGISSTQETVKTAGGSVGEYVCVCVHSANVCVNSCVAVT